ncbi:MAG TPA: ABC transporter permease [Phycisphaerales bacterium]|nr:ABC transporter permease [Phycisphaerales bacterium]
MMMRQTAALFVDAYRELNSRKLFWITLMLSGLVVAAFAAVGIDKQGFTILWFRLDFIPLNSDILSPALLYKTMFLSLGLKIWLAWIAAILALITTAGMIPDLIAGGSIEMMLSKPVSRVRLFLTKYAAGLLFVTFQVGVFSLASFFVIGVRGGEWEPALLLAIPLVVAFFSFLFCMCVLFGLLTRSTIASLLLTLLFWFFIFILNAADGALVQWRSMAEAQRDALVRQVAQAEGNTRQLLIAERRSLGEELPEDYHPTEEEIAGVNPFLKGLRDKRASAEKTAAQAAKWSGILFAAKTIVPKTGETIDLLERTLISMADLEALTGSSDKPRQTTVDEQTAEVEFSQYDLSMRSATILRERSVLWILGTSFAFEAVVLALSCVIFARRDF